MQPSMLMLASLLFALGQPVPDIVRPAMMVPDQQRRADQMQAWQARRQGRILPLPEIERRVVPHMRGSQYIGFDFDPGNGVYTLKFLRNGSVIWVDVDGSSGQVVGRSGG